MKNFRILECWFVWSIKISCVMYCTQCIACIFLVLQGKYVVISWYADRALIANRVVGGDEDKHWHMTASHKCVYVAIFVLISLISPKGNQCPISVSITYYILPLPTFTQFLLWNKFKINHLFLFFSAPPLKEIQEWNRREVPYEDLRRESPQNCQAQSKICRWRSVLQAWPQQICWHAASWVRWSDERIQPIKRHVSDPIVINSCLF